MCSPTGAYIIDDRGVETKHFDVRDGQGISLLKRAGVRVGFITGRSSNVVRHRASDLRVTIVYQGAGDKVDIYEQIKRKTGLTTARLPMLATTSSIYQCCGVLAWRLRLATVRRNLSRTWIT